MSGHPSKQKPLAYLLLGASVLISLIHIWQPLTISPPNLQDRTGLPVVIAIFAALTAYGYRWARVGIGLGFTLLALVNLLILIAYLPTLSVDQLTEIIFVSMLLGATGIVFLKWKGIRVFEAERF